MLVPPLILRTVQFWTVVIPNECEGSLDLSSFEMTENPFFSCSEQYIGAGGQVHFLHADVSDEPSVQAMALQIVDQFGRVDVLVNNTGIAHPVASLAVEIGGEYDR